MDWNIANINNTSLRWYGYTVIQDRKKSNRYTTFLQCVCKEYHFGDNNHKRRIINMVMGIDMYPSDVAKC